VRTVGCRHLVGVTFRSRARGGPETVVQPSSRRCESLAPRRRYRTAAVRRLFVARHSSSSLPASIESLSAAVAMCNRGARWTSSVHKDADDLVMSPFQVNCMLKYIVVSCCSPLHAFCCRFRFCRAIAHRTPLCTVVEAWTYTSGRHFTLVAVTVLSSASCFLLCKCSCLP
jgi:hypothetical protein